MSDASGAGTNDILDLTVGVQADTTKAQADAMALGNKIVSIGRSATGSSTTGFRLFGVAASQTFNNITQQAELMNRQMGASSPFVSMLPAIEALNGPLQNFGEMVDQDNAKLSALRITGMSLSAVGGVVMGLGAVFQQVSAPLQMAQASLANSIANTTNTLTGQADSISNYSDKIQGAVNQGAKWGFSADAVNKSLAQLTEETRSAPEAFNELQFAETLAGATAESTKSSYLDLAGATALVGRMHAGLFRSLRRFGIDIPSMLVNPQKDATKAANELASATQKLTDAQRNLDDYNAKVSADEQKRQQEWQQKVQTTSAAAQTSQQAYQDQLQKVTDAEQKMQDASTKAQQTQSDNATKLAQDQQNAAQKVADAQQKVEDLKQQWSDQDAQLAAKAAQDQQDTTQAIIDAENNLNDLQDQWSETPARTAKDQLTRLDQLRKAEDALQKVKDDAAKKAAADQLSPSQQLQRTTQMQAAQQALNKAVADQGKLTQEASKMQEQNRKALEASTLAAQAYARAQERTSQLQAKAQTDQQKAQNAQTQLSAAGGPTLAQSQELDKLQEAQTKAQAAVNKAKQAQADAANFQGKLDAQFTAAMNQFMSREQGLPQRRAATMAGHFAAIRAEVTNTIQSLGKFAPIMMTMGMGAAGIGQMIALGGRAREVINKMRGDANKASDSVKSTGESLSGLEEGVGAAEDASGSVEKLGGSFANTESAASSASGGVEQLAMKFGGVSSGAEEATAGVAAGGEGIMGAVTGLGAAIISPIGLIIAAIVGIAAIGYVIYRNWGTISKMFEKLWGWISHTAKAIFNDLWDFFKRWGPLILTAFAPFIGLPLLIFQHWGQIEGFFKNIGSKVLTWADHFGHDVVNGILTGLMDLMHMDAWLIEWLWTSIKKMWDWAWNELKSMGSDIVNGLINGIGSMGDAVWKAVKKYLVDNVKNSITSGFGLWSPSRVMHSHGQNIVQGLINGIMSKGHDAKNAMDTVVTGIGTGAGLGGGVALGGALASSSSLAPTLAGGNTNLMVNVPLTIQGNVLTEKDLQNNLKTFLQQGAQQAGGIGRFLGLNVSST